MYPAILIALILLSLAGIGYAVNALVGELQDLGGDEDAGAADRKRTLKDIEKWRNGQ